ncbi:hypothetical protein DXG01_008062 [Tephrocybe rancida]|nr:hypothetical protein DXG01_008062 [Tephrocybe rancida]
MLLGWVTGTGGGICIRVGDRVYIAPSGVQKERIEPSHIFVLPFPQAEPSPHTDRVFLRRPAMNLKESACTPLFWNSFDLRNAGSCIHTHSQHAVMATLLWDGPVFRISHQMIKGVRIAGTGSALSYLDTLELPIIENTPNEEDLKDSMAEAMIKYPDAAGVLVRRHGVYVWGNDWEKAKTQTECLDYLFEIGVKMKLAGLPTSFMPSFNFFKSLRSTNLSVSQGCIIMDYDLNSDDASSSVRLEPAANNVGNPNFRGGGSNSSMALEEALARCYRGQQKEIIEAAMRGASNHNALLLGLKALPHILGDDVLVIAPTGMGKSLCFQVPAAAEQSGITVVVSPLLALMKNQVDSLVGKSIAAVSLTSETPAAQKQEYYIPFFRPASRANALLTKEWGHDFRAVYRRLGIFRRRFPVATLTLIRRVQTDIIRSLELSESRLHRALHPFNRANLFYEVHYFARVEPVFQMTQVFEYITTLYRRRKRPSSGVIYCRKRATCDELSRFLRTKGINSQPYHRGINSNALDKTLREWTIGGAGEGGVDVDTIRRQVNRQMTFIRIAKLTAGKGRAGRDGFSDANKYLQPITSHPNAFFTTVSVTKRPRIDVLTALPLSARQDAREVQKWINNSAEARLDQEGPPPSQRAKHSLSALFKFAENVETCRHVSICRYFDEDIDAEDAEVLRRYCDNMCDVCKYPGKTKHRVAKLSTEVSLKFDLPIDRGQKMSGTGTDATGWRTNPDGRVTNNPVSGQRSHLGGRSYGMTKRAAPELVFGAGAKRARTLAPALGEAPHKGYKCVLTEIVTKPHASTSGLSKPFKTPFRTPPIKPVAPPALLPPLESSRYSEANSGDEQDTETIDCEEVTISGTAAAHECLGPSSTEVPDIVTELEVSFSGKIPMTARLRSFNDIRRALYGILILRGDNTWDALTARQASAETRINLVCAVAKDLEFSCLSMSSTIDGYIERSEETAAIINTHVQHLLQHEKSWDVAYDEDDSAQAVACVIRRLCKTCI